MSKNHFIVSVKTTDDTPLFPLKFNGENFLVATTAQVSAKTGVLLKGFASFPTGLELILYCNDVQDARKYTDEVASAIYAKTNSLGHIIYSFGIHIGVLTNDERTLHAIMSDMMTRSMAARGIDFDSIPTIKFDMDGKSLS